MRDLAEVMKRARRDVRVRWSDEQSRDIELALPRLRRRRLLHRAAWSTFAIAFLVLGLRARFHHGVAPPVQSAAPSAGDRSIHFADGSTATPLTDQSVVRLVSRTATRDVVAVDHGGARFSVAHDPARVFRVEAGKVAVEVLGTRFTVDRIEDRVRVSVESGRVRVLTGDDHVELGAGESDTFPYALAPTVHAAAKAGREPHAPPPPLDEPEPIPAAPRWDALAKEGEFDRAYAELKKKGAPRLRDEPSELLAAADVARLSHHPLDAVAPLQRMIAAHAPDARAPLAAFTLGRIFLEDLGRPREAAEAFATSQKLASDGVLAPDALAREVEAWSKAGEVDRARSRADEYVRRFPAGSRLRSVRRYGGLE